MAQVGLPVALPPKTGGSFLPKKDKKVHCRQSRQREQALVRGHLQPVTSCRGGCIKCVLKVQLKDDLARLKVSEIKARCMNCSLTA